MGYKQILNVIVVLIICFILYTKSITFKSINLILLIISIIIVLYLWHKPGFSNNGTFNFKTTVKWLKDNGYQLDSGNSTIVRKDGKVISLLSMGNEKSVKDICGNKELTSTLLMNNGIKVPSFYVCDNKLSIEDNLENIYLKLNPPFVVKPTKGSKGIGVYVDINTYDDLHNKVKKTMKNISGKGECMVEEYYKGGKDYRIFTHKNKIVDIVEKVSGEVKGDGISILSELIQKYNKNNKTQIGAAKGHTIKNIDEEYFKKQGYKLDGVVPYGKTVKLSGVVNLSNGAVSRPVNINDVHPDNILMFEKCSELIGGVNLGIDYVSSSISLSYITGGVIIEVNSNPGFGPHRVAHKASDEIHKKFIEALFE